MSELSVEAYKQQVLQCKLVDSDQLEKVCAQLTQSYGDKPFDVDALSEALVENKLVTLWQNKMIVEGRHETLLGGRHRGFFVGSYKLLKHLGTGGMNSVYLAEHTVMRRQVAIKVLSLSGEEDPAFLDRFRMESRAIAALDDPNIVRAHDFNNEGDIYYLVMEYVEGKDLHHIVKEKGPLPFETAADYIKQAAKGLAHAHDMGLIHRDIKPANLLVDNKRTVKLLDLGIARLENADDEASITRNHSDSILGTADYLAPEQALDSHTVDSRADVYSLGCTLYFLLTGHPPFNKGSLAQRMLMHQMQEPPSIYEDRPNAPSGLVEICQKMMAKKPEDRYQTAKDVVKALEGWLEERQQEAEDEEASSTRGGASDTFAGLGASTTMGRTRRKRAAQQEEQKKSEGSDSKIICKTCGTPFGRYMYRYKCPKCGTVNNPVASWGQQSYSSGQFGALPSPPPSSPGISSGGTGGGQAEPMDPNVKASCPKCNATYTARWTKCLNCGAATILHGDSSTEMTTKSVFGDNYGSQTPPGGYTPGGQYNQQPQGGQDPYGQQAGAGAGAGGAAAAAGSPAEYGAEQQPYGVEGENWDQGDQYGGEYYEEGGVEAEAQYDAATGVQEEPLESAYSDTQTFAEETPSSFDPEESYDADEDDLSEAAPRKSVVGTVLAVILMCVVFAGAAGAMITMGGLTADENKKQKTESGGYLEGEMVDGKKSGHWREFDASGQLLWEGHYVDGEKHRDWKTFDENGQLIEEGRYNKGKRDGAWTFFYPDGQMKEQGSFKNDKRHGEWVYYHPDGTKWKVGRYDNGEPSGEWLEWNKDRELIRGDPQKFEKQ